MLTSVLLYSIKPGVVIFLSVFFVFFLNSAGAAARTGPRNKTDRLACRHNRFMQVPVVSASARARAIQTCRFVYYCYSESDLGL